MLTHPDIGFAGRLGNAMFQYAALKGISRKLGYKPVLLKDVYDRVWDGQRCQLDFFTLNIDHIENSELEKFSNIHHEISPRVFDSTVLDLKPNTLLYGHYENYKYFQDIEDEIKNDFTLIPEIKEKGKLFLSDKVTIAIHIRLGDYSHIYKPEFENKEHWIHGFLKDAISQFDDIENKEFICFTGGNKQDGQDKDDITFLHCLIAKHTSNFKISEGNQPIVDFSILTQVDHIIILTFSTFIWWASFLNTSPNKKVIVPKNAMFAKDTDFWHPSFVQL